MKILVTGGAGFLGSHLCRKMLEQGDYVICLDNFITGTKENIRVLLQNPSFKFVEHDISKPIFFKEKLDWVLHFASLASPAYYIEYPIKTLKSGLLGTHNCLGIAKEKNAKFFLASTSEIYGDPLVHPQTEEYLGNVSSTGLRSCYDESKRGAEALTYAYWRKHNLDVRVIRIFNTYGPNMQIDDGRVVSNFVVQALRGEDVTIYGDGEQTRSFCYVDDLIAGIMKLIQTDYNQPLNLGNPAEYKVIDLATVIIKLVKSKSKILFKPLPQGDPKRRRPDISKARKILDWNPAVELNDGLKKTIEWFDKQLSSCENV